MRSHRAEVEVPQQLNAALRGWCGGISFSWIFHLAVLALLTVAPPALAERRVALVIGNSQYQSVARLGNPGNDAQALAKTLTDIGFDQVTVRTDLTRDQLNATLRDFAREADKADWAMVYYSGHGIEVGGVNYMVPIDARLTSDRDVEFEAIDLNRVMTAVSGASRLRMVVLDACRDNPFINQMKRTLASRSVGRGLGQVEPEAGTLVAYAARAGSVALDGDGNNSPFMTSLLTRIRTPDLEVRRLFDLVRDDVLQRTNRQQQPFTYGSLPGSQDYYFTKAAAVSPPSPSVVPRGSTECDRRVDPQATAQSLKTADVEGALQACVAAAELAPGDARLLRLLQVAQDQRAFRKAIDSQERAFGEAYLALFPEGRFVTQVRQHLAALAPSPAPVPQLDPKELARVLQVELGRVGCTAGTPDGVWGGASQAALQQFNRFSNTKFEVAQPTMAALDDIRGRKGRVCPLSCKIGFKVEGDSCVAIVCPAGHGANAAGMCAPLPPPSPAAPRNCITFNGQQFCG